MYPSREGSGMSETKYAVMDERNHIYITFPTHKEAEDYIASGRSWVRDCRVAKIILYPPVKTAAFKDTKDPAHSRGTPT